MSWPCNHLDALLKALASDIQSQTGIETNLFTGVPIDNTQPTITLEFAGAKGDYPQRSKMDWWYKGPIDRDNSYLMAQDIMIPVDATLVYSGSGDVFAGTMVLSSVVAARYFYTNACHKVKVGSVDFTKTNISTGDPVNFLYNINDVSFRVEAIDNGIAFDGDPEHESWEFSQTYNCILRLRAAKILELSEV